jgi:hypothetical protein
LGIGATEDDPSIPQKLFEYSEDIRSAMVVDIVGNVVSFASRTKVTVDPSFVNDMTSKWTAVLGGMLRGSEKAYGVLMWLHLRYDKLHVYGWLVDQGYLVFTSRSQLEDELINRISSTSPTRARYARGLPKND